MVRVVLAVHGWYHPASQDDRYSEYMARSLQSAGIQFEKLEGWKLPHGRFSQLVFSTTLRYVLDYVDRNGVIHDLFGDSVFKNLDVATIHDLYWNTPQIGMMPRALQVVQLIYQDYWRTLKRAKKVIVTSKFTRDQIGKYYGQEYLAKLVEIPIPCAPEKEFKKQSTQYDVIWIGSNLRRKSLLEFLKVIGSLPKQFRVAIIAKKVSGIVGEDPRTIRDLVQALNADGHSVSFIERRLTDDELDDLYRNSKCLVSSSTYEGFHSPVSEAYLRGTHIVLPLSPIYSCQYSNEDGVHWYRDREEMRDRILNAVEYGHFSPSCEIARKLSYANVGKLLKATYEDVSRF